MEWGSGLDVWRSPRWAGVCSGRLDSAFQPGTPGGGAEFGCGGMRAGLGGRVGGGGGRVGRETARLLELRPQE